MLLYYDATIIVVIIFIFTIAELNTKYILLSVFLLDDIESLERWFCITLTDTVVFPECRI